MYLGKETSPTFIHIESGLQGPNVKRGIYVINVKFQVILMYKRHLSVSDRIWSRTGTLESTVSLELPDSCKFLDLAVLDPKGQSYGPTV